MEEIKISKKLSDKEINKYCKINNKTLIMVSYKDDETILKVV